MDSLREAPEEEGVSSADACNDRPGAIILLGVLVDQQWGLYRDRRRVVEAARTNATKSQPAE